MIHFTKMQGLGNDFIVINNIKGDISLSSEEIKKLANRRFGIGFDQLLMIESTSKAKIDFKYIIFNADGLEASQCGNGARCFASYVVKKGLIKKNIIKVETKEKIMTLEIISNNIVKVNMGKPIFEAAMIPIATKELKQHYVIEGQNAGVLSMGNPHAVIICDEIINKDIKPISIKIQNNKFFPKSVNVGFMKIIAKNKIALRVYERGVGETLACGSGACAAVVYGKKWGF